MITRRRVAPGLGHHSIHWLRPARYSVLSLLHDTPKRDSAVPGAQDGKIAGIASAY